MTRDEKRIQELEFEVEVTKKALATGWEGYKALLLKYCQFHDYLVQLSYEANSSYSKIYDDLAKEMEKHLNE